MVVPGWTCHISDGGSARKDLGLSYLFLGGRLPPNSSFALADRKADGDESGLYLNLEGRWVVRT